MTDKKSLADWVTENAIAADSLDPRAPLDDLEPLREVVGDARLGVHDAESFQRMRMEDYCMDVPIFDAFDAVAYVPHTRCTARRDR